jgi:hypothetical protein
MQRFIGGFNIHQAIQKVASTPFIPIFDYAKEGVMHEDQAQAYANSVISDAHHVDRKRSAFALKYSSFQNDGILKDTVQKLLQHTSLITFDAETYQQKESEQRVCNDMIQQHCTKVYKTYQMYRIDSFNQLRDDIHRYDHLSIKLVRGAYYAKDRPHVFANKYETDLNYNNAIRYIIPQMSLRNIRLMIATHNIYSMEYAQTLRLDRQRVSFAQLMGMQDAYGNNLVQKGYTVYKYVPYGSFLEMYPYLLRRLYENYGILQHLSTKCT